MIRGRLGLTDRTRAPAGQDHPVKSRPTATAHRSTKPVVTWNSAGS
jgi:hypothetical protein